jgi:hypothetical protein
MFADPLAEAAGRAGDASIATVASVPVATLTGAPQPGHGWPDSASSELQVAHRGIALLSITRFRYLTIMRTCAVDQQH